MRLEVGQWYLCTNRIYLPRGGFRDGDVCCVVRISNSDELVAVKWSNGPTHGECWTFLEQNPENFRLLSDEEVLIYKMSL
jgi:hypothetical protein